MNIHSISQTQPQVSFTGKNDQYAVRNLWMSGKLPMVTTDIYGLPLSKKTCSREHIIPKSKGGSNANHNIALADRFINSKRGTQPLSKFTTLDNVVNYFKQFFGVQIKEGNNVRFDGDKYFTSCIPSLKHEGFNIDVKNITKTIAHK